MWFIKIEIVLIYNCPAVKILFVRLFQAGKIRLTLEKKVFFLFNYVPLPSPVTNSPSQKLLLGAILDFSNSAKCSTLAKNSGFMRCLFLSISFIISLLNAGGGSQKASNPEKKCRIPSAILSSG